MEVPCQFRKRGVNARHQVFSLFRAFDALLSPGHTSALQSSHRYHDTLERAWISPCYCQRTTAIRFVLGSSSRIWARLRSTISPSEQSYESGYIHGSISEYRPLEQEPATLWILMELSAHGRGPVVYPPSSPCKKKHGSTVNIWKTVNPELVTYLGCGPLDWPQGIIILFSR